MESEPDSPPAAVSDSQRSIVKVRGSYRDGRPLVRNVSSILQLPHFIRATVLNSEIISTLLIHFLTYKLLASSYHNLLYLYTVSYNISYVHNNNHSVVSVGLYLTAQSFITCVWAVKAEDTVCVFWDGQ